MSTVVTSTKKKTTVEFRSGSYYDLLEMGNNHVRELGIAPSRKISSKEYGQIWRKYDKNKNRLTMKQALKFMKDFSEAVGVKYDKARAEKLIHEADVDQSGWLNYEQFKKLFFSTAKEANVGLTTSLITELGDVSDEEENPKEKKVNLKGMQQLLKSSLETKITEPTEHKDDPKPEVKQDTQDPLENLFAHYKAIKDDNSEEEDDPTILKGMGILQLSQDLGITDEKDPTLIIMFWKLKVNQPNVWEISKEEFLGWKTHGCTDIQSMKKKLATWREGLKVQEEFKQFYFFLFDYLREDKKILSLEEAFLAWEMLHMEERWQLWNDWAEFMKGKAAVTRDTWRLFYNFTQQHSKDLNNYDDDGCWPSVFDDFVEHMKKK